MGGRYHLACLMYHAWQLYGPGSGPHGGRGNHLDMLDVPRVAMVDAATHKQAVLFYVRPTIDMYSHPLSLRQSMALDQRDNYRETKPNKRAASERCGSFSGLVITCGQ